MTSSLGLILQSSFVLGSSLSMLMSIGKIGAIQTVALRRGKPKKLSGNIPGQLVDLTKPGQ